MNQTMGFWLAVSFVIATALVGLYDLWAIWTLGREETVSHYLQVWSRNFPGLPFALGFVIGHLLFPMP